MLSRAVRFALALSSALLATPALGIASELPAYADDPAGGAPVDPALTETATAQGVPATPPPILTPYLQYGVAFTAEVVPDAEMCHGKPECILGSGGGIAIHIGRRFAGPWYFGGAYELTKQDSGTLYRLATLQQGRAEARYYVTTGRDTQPFGSVGGGLVAYGNEGGIDTWGPFAFTGIGVETQLSRHTVIGFAFAYRLMRFAAWVDSSNESRPAGFAHVIGLDLSLEGRDPI